MHLCTINLPLTKSKNRSMFIVVRKVVKLNLHRVAHSALGLVSIGVFCSGFSV